MFRSALAWTLTAGFLVTIPVTGAGYCPCRLAGVLRGQTPTAQPTDRATTPPQPCKGCCHAPQDNAPAGASRNESPQPPNDPSGTPCGHHFAFDAAPAGASGERTGVEYGSGDSDAAIGVAARPHAPLTYEPAASSDLSMAAPPGPRFLRYAHAFRC